MRRTLRRVRRRFTVLTLVPAAWWAWNERHVLAGMATFARTVPDRLRLGRGTEVALAAKVNVALLREPRLRGADVRLGAVQGHEVCLESARGAAADAELARRIVERVHGVWSVRVDDCGAVAQPSVVTRHGAVAGAGDGDVPLRI